MPGATRRIKEIQHVEPQLTEEKVLKYIEQNPEIVGILIRQTSSFQGPLPQPDDLAEYGNIQADLVERIMAMAEKEQAHRHTRERKLIAQITRGQWLGFSLGIIAICGAVFLLNVQLAAPESLSHIISNHVHSSRH